MKTVLGIILFEMEFFVFPSDTRFYGKERLLFTSKFALLYYGLFFFPACRKDD